MTARLIQAFYDAGVPESQLQQIDSSTESAIAAIEDGVDLIVLTGAASTGRRVLQQAADSLTPAIMELSGCDAVVVMPGADLQRTADAITFGLNFNSGATCIGPRRLIVEDSMAESLAAALQERLINIPAVVVHPAARESTAVCIERAIGEGAIDRMQHFDAARLRGDGLTKPVLLDHVTEAHDIASADLFAPVTSLMRVGHIDDSTRIVNECPYRLAASVFGPPRDASSLAATLKVGSVSINDLIVPTADPRLPFGGRGDSGFGVTRGVEGLLAMTVPRVTSRRRGKFAPHLRPPEANGQQALMGALQLLHAGTLGKRIGALRSLMAAGKNNPPESPMDRDS